MTRRSCGRPVPIGGDTRDRMSSDGAVMVCVYRRIALRARAVQWNAGLKLDKSASSPYQNSNPVGMLLLLGLPSQSMEITGGLRAAGRRLPVPPRRS